MAIRSAEKLARANGVLVLPKRWFGLCPEMVIHGGPYRHHPDGMFGVCLLERGGDCDVWFPIEDFRTPDPSPRGRQELGAALRAALTEMLHGRPIYVGCMGGQGRTGLFLALLSKVATAEKNPVWFVREQYNARAVETAEQEAFVAEFDASELRRWLFWETLRARLRRATPAMPALAK